MSVTVQYKTQRHYCNCCNNKLAEPVVKDREFEIRKQHAEDWTDWAEFAEYPEDITSIVEDFVQDVISFHAMNSYEQLLIEDSEIDKVRDFIMSEILSPDI